MIAGAMGVASSVAQTVAPMEQAKELFEKQIAQDRRFFYAQYAESVAYHQEAYEQAAKQHAQSYAQSAAAYWQNEQFHRQEFELARLQHKRDMEVTLQAEVRDGLRDEFAIKNNRFNTLMVCDTVMMGCAFGLVSDGSLPEGSVRQVVWTYMSGLSVSISLLTVSLWYSFIVCRRLNQVTAWALLEMEPSRSRWEDEMNAQRLQQRFDEWFNRHCRTMSVWAERALTGGVIALFVAASALLYARMQIEIQQEIASAWMFVGFASATGLFILFLERRESKLKKKKQGVYRPAKDISAQRNKIALNEATDELLRNAVGELRQESGPIDGSAASKALLREVSRSAAERQRAWDSVPSVEEVADEAARAKASAGTEQWLQKAHELLREGLEGEKQWKHDPNDDLFLIGKQAAAARRPQSQGAQEPMEDLPSTRRHGDDASHAETDSAKESAARPRTHTAALERDTSSRSMIPSTARLMDNVAGRTAADQDGILRMSQVSMADMRRAVGEYARSSIITVTNRTDVALRLIGQSLTKGSWCAGFTPPESIPPRSEAVFAGCSESFFGVPKSGTEGSVIYETVLEEPSNQSCVWSFEFIWSNKLIVDSRGRFVKHNVTRPTRQWSLAEYFVVSDGVDQDDNNEVRFIVAAEGDKNAAGDIGVECGLNLSPGEVTHWGLLEKSNAAGIAWERRLFMLTETKLLYVENKRSRKAKRELQLLNISTVECDDFQPHEFNVIMHKDVSATNAGDAGRTFQLRAIDANEAEEWIHQIKTALHRARSAIHVHVSNALNKYETVKCQPTDRVIDLKHAIAARFGVQTGLQELHCQDDFADADELARTLSSPATGRIIEDDFAQLQSVGIRDGQQLYLNIVGTLGGDMSAATCRTMSSALRERVSRSFSTSIDAEATRESSTPEPEGD